MKVKELRKYLFSGAQVKLVLECEKVFVGHANELPYCPYSEYEVNAEGISTALYDNVIRIAISSPVKGIEIPKEFDSYEVPNKVSDRFIQERIPTHVTILDSYVHYMTKETRYSLRIEHLGLFNDRPQEEYAVVSEAELRELYMRGKEKEE